MAYNSTGAVTVLSGSRCHRFPLRHGCSAAHRGVTRSERNLHLSLSQQAREWLLHGYPSLRRGHGTCPVSFRIEEGPLTHEVAGIDGVERARSDFVLTNRDKKSYSSISLSTYICIYIYIYRYRYIYIDIDINIAIHVSMHRCKYLFRPNVQRNLVGKCQRHFEHAHSWNRRFLSVQGCPGMPRDPQEGPMDRMSEGPWSRPGVDLESVWRCSEGC